MAHSCIKSPPKFYFITDSDLDPYQNNIKAFIYQYYFNLPFNCISKAYVNVLQILKKITYESNNQIVCGFLKMRKKTLFPSRLQEYCLNANIIVNKEEVPKLVQLILPSYYMAIQMQVNLLQLFFLTCQIVRHRHGIFKKIGCCWQVYLT